MDAGARQGPYDLQEPSMQAVTTIGLDIAKSGISGARHRRGRQRAHPPQAEAALRPGVLREAATMPGRHRSLRLVASLVARELGARAERGWLMPPAYAKPYVKRQKVTLTRRQSPGPTCGFVETKTPRQQGCLMLQPYGPTASRRAARGRWQDRTADPCDVNAVLVPLS